MADKTDAGGQPTVEKLERELVSPRRCISYEGLGEYSGGKTTVTKSGSGPVLSSMGPMRKSKGGY